MMEDLRQPGAVENDKNSVVKLQQKPRASFSLSTLRNVSVSGLDIDE